MNTAMPLSPFSPHKSYPIVSIDLDEIDFHDKDIKQIPNGKPENRSEANREIKLLSHKVTAEFSSKKVYALVKTDYTGDEISDYRNFETEFEIKFTPKAWVFKKSFRIPERAFFANDATRQQYLQARKIVHFDIRHPKYIVREKITNNDTCLALAFEKSGTQSFLTTFLDQTPNGKHTNNVIRDFGFSARKAYWKKDSIIVELFC